MIVGGDAKKLNLSVELQKKIDELQMSDRIFLEGEREDVDQYFNRSKLFAFTSSSEGFPNVIGEALSAGLPVVAYDCMAGPASLIYDSKNGYIVPMFDKEQFRLKLMELMTNEQLRNAFSKNSGIKIRNFREDVIAEMYYQAIISNHKVLNYV